MRSRLSIRLLVCGAVASSALLYAAALPGGIAGAPDFAVTCTSLSGGAASQTVSGCTGMGAVAADAGNPPAHGVLTTATSTIRWSNGKTSREKYPNADGSASSCPTVAKYTKDILVTEKGTVIGGTAAGLVGGAISAKVCVYKLTATPHTILERNKGSLKL